MNIRITETGHNFSISLTDRLVFNRFVLRAALKSGARDLPPEAEKRLLAELKRIRQSQGSWVLVEIQSAKGEQVTITV